MATSSAGVLYSCGVSLFPAPTSNRANLRTTIFSPSFPIRSRTRSRMVSFGSLMNGCSSRTTAAALRSLELDADVLLMAKNRVDGVYSADPNSDPSARRYKRISHQEAVERDLKVMDMSALALLRDNGLPIVVFDISHQSAIEEAALGEPIGTLVTPGSSEFF